jgi:hypothetical protein
MDGRILTSTLHFPHGKTFAFRARFLRGFPSPSPGESVAATEAGEPLPGESAAAGPPAAPRTGW